MQVFRYAIEAEGDTTVEMPKDAEILRVVMASTGLTILALVNVDEPETAERTFSVVGNGVELPAGVSKLHYLDTVKAVGGPTWNVFETTSVKATA